MQWVFAQRNAFQFRGHPFVQISNPPVTHSGIADGFAPFDEGMRLSRELQELLPVHPVTHQLCHIPTGSMDLPSGSLPWVKHTSCSGQPHPVLSCCPHTLRGPASLPLSSEASVCLSSVHYSSEICSCWAIFKINILSHLKSSSSFRSIFLCLFIGKLLEGVVCANCLQFILSHSILTLCHS